MKKIITKGVKVYTFQHNETDYISLTDIARYKDIAFEFASLKQLK